MNHPTVILDGATGTMLQAAGMPAGVCAEVWVQEHPTVIRQLQHAYAAAGSQVVYAPTFGANPIKLAQHGLAEKTAQINAALVALSRAAVGGHVLVAGDMAPTGKFVPPVGDTPFEALYAAYHAQAGALEAAGVDLFVIETTMTMAEARAALLAVKAVSQKPVFVSFTVEEHGRTITGTDALAALTVMQAMGADAFGLNCSTGPEAMLEQLRRLAPHAAVPLIAKPNAGLPETVDGQAVYRCAPEEFASYVPALAQAGVRIFGGCCGTTPAHIAAVKAAVDALPPLPRPAGPDRRCLATERDAFVFDRADLDSALAIRCSEDLEDDLLDAEEEDAAYLRLTLSGPEDIPLFEQAQYAIRKPLILACDDGAVLEKALRLYQGLAVMDAPSLPAEELTRLERTYGALSAV